MSQLGAEHHPSRDEIAGASEDEREAARMLIVAARFGHGPWGAACTDMVPVPNLRVQVAGALSCGVIGPCCGVIGCRRSTWQRPSQVERRQRSVESDTSAGASDLRVLAGVRADAVLRTRQRGQLLWLSAGIAGEMRLAGPCAACRSRTSEGAAVGSRIRFDDDEGCLDARTAWVRRRHVV